VSDALAFHRNALQLFHCLTNIVDSHVIRDVCSADAWRHNKAHLPAFKFLIELYCIDNLLTRKLRRQTRGQRESGEEINDRGALICRQPGSFQRDRARGDNSQADCFSMEEFPVISGALDRVANRVAEIQKRALARPVALIFRDDSGFDLDIALDKPL